MDIVDDSSVEHHPAKVAEHGRKKGRDRTRGTHRLPERSTTHEIETLTSAIDLCCDGKVGKPHILDLCATELSLQCPVEADMIEQRISGKGPTFEPAAGYENILESEINLCGCEKQGEPTQHCGSGTCATQYVELHSKLLKGLKDTGMGRTESAAASSHETHCAAS